MWRFELSRQSLPAGFFPFTLLSLYMLDFFISSLSASKSKQQVLGGGE